MTRRPCAARVAPTGSGAPAQIRIVKEEGPVGLFRGAGPTVVRAMALNMGMLASNDQVGLHVGWVMRGRHAQHCCPVRECRSLWWSSGS